MPATWPLVVIIVAGIAYHVAQKSLSAASPWPILTVAYGVAFALSLGLALTQGEGPVRGRPLPYLAAVLVGLAAFGIEAGFFFLYRAGWKLASASVLANVVVTSVLALVGVLVFREQMTVVRGTGIALATGGAILLARGGH